VESSGHQAPPLLRRQRRRITGLFLDGYPQSGELPPDNGCVPLGHVDRVSVIGDDVFTEPDAYPYG